MFSKKQTHKVHITLWLQVQCGHIVVISKQLDHHHMVEFIPKCPLIPLLAFSMDSSDVSKASRSVLSGPFEPNKTQKQEKQTE